VKKIHRVIERQTEERQRWKDTGNEIGTENVKKIHRVIERQTEGRQMERHRK